MGSKDVWADSGSSPSPEPGVSLPVLCWRGNPYPGTARNLPKRQESYENILSEKGILYRMNRTIQVEGAFGVLKNDYEFQRFLLRGKTRVKLEILLLSLGYNLNKLHAKIQNGRTGSHLFEVKSA